MTSVLTLLLPELPELEPTILSVEEWAGVGSEAEVLISCGILVLLFTVQRFGTDKVGFSFALIILVWFAFIGMIGLYNLFKHDVGILRALNPYYMIDYLRRNGRQVGHRSEESSTAQQHILIKLETGTEAMFADLGHFNMPAIQTSFSFIVFPVLLMAYTGQAAYLTKFPQTVASTLYSSIPSLLYWPTFVVAVAAAIVVSQSMITVAFSIISQSQSLGCFPRVKVVHTSSKYEGQVYIPEVNYILMVGSVIATLGFGNPTKIATLMEWQS
ncbi:hypothetical protein MLD38_025427 [Melastoma candidum]|uniref:Uncharacterized protein n=1 Tax=Melastoma candidum TaxID=119954 RepID=A0ACB9NYG2_9MYRT|nr:hypothetical protein MLD38_025427 [Melastoma candidum]